MGMAQEAVRETRKKNGNLAETRASLKRLLRNAQKVNTQSIELLQDRDYLKKSLTHSFLETDLEVFKLSNFKISFCEKGCYGRRTWMFIEGSVDDSGMRYAFIFAGGGLRIDKGDTLEISFVKNITGTSGYKIIPQYIKNTNTQMATLTFQHSYENFDTTRGNNYFSLHQEILGKVLENNPDSLAIMKDMRIKTLIYTLYAAIFVFITSIYFGFHPWNFGTGWAILFAIPSITIGILATMSVVYRAIHTTAIGDFTKNNYYYQVRSNYFEMFK